MIKMEFRPETERTRQPGEHRRPISASRSIAKRVEAKVRDLSLTSDRQSVFLERLISQRSGEFVGEGRERNRELMRGISPLNGFRAARRLTIIEVAVPMPIPT